MNERNSTGSESTGHQSTGHHSTGYRSTGSWSTGGRSIGDRSTGHRSTGYGSTGSWSTGHRSTGNRSMGNGSTGHRSTGYKSTGDKSTGHKSTGDWSTSNFSTGHFSTDDASPTFFDLPFDGTWEEAEALVPHIELKLGTYWVDAADMTDAEKADHPEHKTTSGYLAMYNHTFHEAFRLAWDDLGAAGRQRFLDLPNFDAEKFLKITGVDVRLEVKRKVTLDDGRELWISEESWKALSDAAK